MKDDATLLRSYAVEGSQDAFAELVRRHLGLVYHAALRQTNGDDHRAEEVAQLVFTDLARKAAALSRRPLLVSWLHTSTRYAANNLRRAELRRRTREQEAYSMNYTDLAPDPAADWQRLRPLIDDALQSLGERDRAAVLLRFFENRSYSELGAALSLNEDAARLRVNRALEKLRSTLARRGLVSTASALGLALAQPALAGVPACLATHVTVTSLAAASATSAAFVGAATGLGGLAGTAKIAVGLVGAATVFSVGVLLYQRPAASPRTAASSSASSPADLAASHPPALPVPDKASAALEAWLASALTPAPPAEFFKRSESLRALLKNLPAGLFPRLLSALAGAPGDDPRLLRPIAFEAWLGRAPADAGRWASAFPLGGTYDATERARFCLQSASAWAGLDFAAAYAWADTLPDPDSRQRCLRNALARLAETDPHRAVALADERGPEFFDAARRDLLRAWCKKAPADAMRALGAPLVGSDSNKHRVELQQGLTAWAAVDAAAAYAWLTSFDQFPSRDAVSQMTSAIRMLPDPRSALDSLTRSTELSAPSALLGDIVKFWAFREPAAAFEWLDTMPDAGQKIDLLAQIQPNLADPERAARYVSSALRLPPSQGLDDLLAPRLAAWAESAPDAALAWLQAQGDHPSLAGASAKVESVFLGALAASDPVGAAARWQALPDAQSRADSMPRIATAWAKTDPAAAARWLGTFVTPVPKELEDKMSLLTMLQHDFGPRYTSLNGMPEHLARTHSALTAATAAWSRQDPLAALRWAETLTDPSYRAAAVGALASEAAAEALPAAKADYLVHIRDDTLRKTALRSHLFRWLKSDAPAARAWLETHDHFSPKESAALIENAAQAVLTENAAK